MKIKQYDRVRLKDGREGDVMEIYGDIWRLWSLLNYYWGRWIYMGRYRCKIRWYCRGDIVDNLKIVYKILVGIEASMDIDRSDGTFLEALKISGERKK